MYVDNRNDDDEAKKDDTKWNVDETNADPETPKVRPDGIID